VNDCTSGSITCSDTTSSNLDICDGVDNDCDASSADGSEDSRVGDTCDGSDTDLCEEGVYSCGSGSLSCSDTTGDTRDVCDGVDNDCNAATEDGFDETCVSPPNANGLCSSGACGFTCISGFANCNTMAADGCEAELAADPSNCGSCGNTCTMGAICDGGICRSMTGLISVGASHTCRVTFTGGVLCVGRNEYGQLGDGSITNRSTPVSVSSISNAVAVTVGEFHSCALLSTGAVRCWGRHNRGQLGDGSVVASSRIPVTVSGITNATSIDAGYQHTCARLSTGSLSCWGFNSYGQLGDRTGTDRRSPVVVSGVSTATSVVASREHSCAVMASGQVYCWGSNHLGRLGDGGTVNRNVPGPVSGISNAMAADSDNGHGCALLSTGEVRCWGWNGFGQVGDGSVVDRYLPTPVSGVSMARGSAAGGAHSCTVLSTGRVQCWGQNTQGQLGDGTTFGRTTPVMVSGITNAIEVSAGGGILSGGSHTCALLSDGSVKCWGDNRYGQLGDGTMTNSSLPVLFGSGGSGDPGGGPGGGSGGSLPALPPAR